MRYARLTFQHSTATQLQPAISRGQISRMQRSESGPAMGGGGARIRQRHFPGGVRGFPARKRVWRGSAVPSQGRWRNPWLRASARDCLNKSHLLLLEADAHLRHAALDIAVLELRVPGLDLRDLRDALALEA